MVMEGEIWETLIGSKGRHLHNSGEVLLHSATVLGAAGSCHSALERL